MLSASLIITFFFSIYKKDIHEIQNFYNLFLEKTTSSFTSDIRNIILNSASILNSPDIKNFFLISEEELENTDTETQQILMECQNNIKRLKINHSHLDSVYLYQFNPDIALTDKGIYKDISGFPEKYYFMEEKEISGNRNYLTQVKLLEKSRNVLAEPVPYHYISIHMPIGNNGILILNIKSSVLEDVVKHIEENLKGISALVFDSNELIINNQNPELNTLINSENFFNGKRIITIKWNNHNWLRFLYQTRYKLSVVHLVPYEEIYSSIYILRNTFAILWLLLLILSIPLARTVEKWATYPLIKLNKFLIEKEFIPSAGNNTKDIGAILTNFEKLISSRSFYKNKLELYQPLLDELTLYYLLNRSENLTPSETVRFRNVMSAFQNKIFKCIIISIDNYKEYKKDISLHDIHEDLNFIGNIVHKLISSCKTIFHIKENMIILITNYNKTPDYLPELENKISNIKSEIEFFLNRTVSIAEGIEVTSIDSLHLSYSTAETAMEYRFLTIGNSILRYDNLPEYPERKGILPDDLKGLKEAIKHFDKEQAEILLLKCFAEIKLEKNIRISFIAGSLSIISELRYFQPSTKLSFPTPEEISFTVNTSDTVEELINYFKSLTNRIISSLMFNKHMETKNISDHMHKVISENYSNPLLQISDIADIFNLSTTYFGRYFHEITGKSFTNYVNEIRISKAKEFLLSTENTVNEIADLVGFNSTQYFIRTFKKMNKITPNRYRAEEGTAR